MARSFLNKQLDVVGAGIAREDARQLRDEVLVEQRTRHADLQRLGTVRRLVEHERLDVDHHELVSTVGAVEVGAHLDENVAHALPGHGVDLALKDVPLLRKDLGEAHAGDVGLHVGQVEDGHLVARLRDLLLKAVDHACPAENLLLGHLVLAGIAFARLLLNLTDAEVASLGQGILEGAQGVVGYVDAEHFLFKGELGAVVPLNTVRLDACVEASRVVVFLEQVEHGELAGRLVLLALCRRVDDVLGVVLAHKPAELLARIARVVKGACLDEGLDDATVRLARIHAIKEVEDVLVGAVYLALGHNEVAHALAHAADAGKTEANALGHRRELVARGVDVWRQHVDTVEAACRDVVNDFLGLTRVGGEHGGHVLAGIVGLEPGRLHNEDGISRRVRLVESIGGELKNVVPNLLGDLLLVAVGHRAVHPVVVRGLFLAVGPVEHRGGQKLDLLLCHGLTDARVRFAGREAAHLHRDLHNLFLVDHGAVGLAKDVVEARVVRDGLLLAVHTVDVGVHHACAQGSGAIQGDKSDDVLVLARLHVLDGGRHAARLDLEDAGRVARTHELEDLGVVERNLGLVDIDAAGGLDVLLGLGDNGKRTQTQEVHLKQAHVGDHVAFVLGDLHATLGVKLRGHMLVDRVSADEDGAGVHALATREALDGQRRVDDLLCVGIFLVGLHKVGREIVLVLLVFAHGRGERRVGGVGNHLGKLLGEAHREAQHASRVVDGLLGLEDRVRDNMRDVVGAVAAADIVHHLQAPLIVEVHIDIGHLGTLGRQESLEHQAVLKRVEARDVHGVRDDGACGRTTARAHTDAVCLGPLHVVGDDKEVGGKTLVADDLVFVLETLHNIGTRGLPIGSVVARQARLAVATELALVGLSLVKTRVTRKDDLVEVQVDARFLVEDLAGLCATLLSDLNRVVAGLLIQGA